MARDINTHASHLPITHHPPSNLIPLFTHPSPTPPSTGVPFSSQGHRGRSAQEDCAGAQRHATTLRWWVGEWGLTGLGVDRGFLGGEPDGILGEMGWDGG